MLSSSRSKLRDVLDAIDAGYPLRAKATLKCVTPGDLADTRLGLIGAASAELWLATGDNTRADEAALLVLRKGAAAEAAARAHTVRAIVLADSGSATRARAAALDAVSAANQTEIPSLKAWTILRLLSILLSSNPSQTQETEKNLDSARAAVYDSGLPPPVALFHTILAARDGRAGKLDRAWKHLAVARDLLLHTAHPVVSTIWSVTGMVVASLGDDYKASVRLGTEALESSIRCGYFRLVPRIRGNLALAYLKAGEVEQSREQFERRGEFDHSQVSQIGLFDSLAQLHMLSGDYSKCAEMLRRAESLFDTHLLYGWYWLSLQETLVEHALATRSSRSREMAIEARAIAERSHHLSFSAVFSILEARAMCAHGDTSSALRAIATDSSLTTPPLCLSVVGRRELVLAEIAQRQDDLARAWLHFGRAQRVLSKVGSGWLRRELAVTAQNLPATAPVTDESKGGSVDFASAGFLVECAQNGEVLATELLEQLQTIHPIAFAALSLEGNEDGTGSVLVDLEDPEGRPPNYVVFVGERNSARLVLKLWTRGVPENNQFGLAIRIAEAAAWQEVARAQVPLPPLVRRLSGTVSDGVFEAPAARKTVNLVDRVSPTVLPVLLLGETGSGKEVLARRLHQRSNRSDGPFVPFNCASISPELLESHLFGHVKGAFTSAVSDFIGIVRSADKGTLFLDEIAELPPMAQPKLLRFLESGEVYAVGASRATLVDVRIVAATNRNIVEMVRSGTFREDLYYRLDGISIQVPPLRERREDIPALASLFIGRFAALLGKRAPRLSQGALELLMLRRWPGNVRELSNEMRRLVALIDDEVEITAQAVRSILISDSGVRVESADMAPAPVLPDLDSAIRDLERRMIIEALRACEGKVSEAASLLGVSRKGLFLKRKRLNV